MRKFAPVGAGRPPRQNPIIAAASTRNYGDSIIVPDARDRLLELIEREQLPGEVRSTLGGSLTGDLTRQQLLFQAMIDTWPHLQKCLREVKQKVRKAPWKVVPWAPRGEKPTAAAEALAKDVENSIWKMKPDMRRGLKGFEGTVEEIAMGYWLGHYVGEIHWTKEGVQWRPECTRTLPPRFYGYPSWEDGEDRLMLDPDGGQSGSMNFEDFPEHRFLTAVNGGHPGHPTIAAPLRALAGYWLAAIYGLKWLMTYAQLFGIPFRWAEYVDDGGGVNKAAIAEMMRKIGSEGWAAFPAGTKMEFLDSSKGGSSLVQRELLKLADEQCDIFILGQSLTTDSGDKGARALGEVHMDVRKELVAGVCDFVGEVLTHQLVPSIVALNHGDSRTDLPGIWAVEEEPKDEKGLAERDNALGITSGKVPVPKAWFYERHGIPMPAAGEEIYEPTPAEEPEQDQDGKPMPPKPGEKKPDPEKEKLAAADAALTWRQFPANYGSLGIPRAEMPQIRSGDRAALVQFFRARGIGSAEETVQADTLKPTQAEYSPEKSRMAGEYKGGNRSILVSQEGHVVDGHHQWWDAVMMQKDIKVIRLQAPIHRVLMMAHRMPSTRVAAGLREDMAAELDDKPGLKALVKRMERAAKEGGIVDADAIADLLGAAWINSAKKAPDGE